MAHLDSLSSRAPSIELVAIVVFMAVSVSIVLQDLVLALIQSIANRLGHRYVFDMLVNLTCVMFPPVTPHLNVHGLAIQTTPEKGRGVFGEACCHVEEW